MPLESDLKIKKVLIANRSEIALRIQATCHTLGIKTVAIYAPEDVLSSYVYKASEAHRLSLSGFSAYLNQEEIIEIAKLSGADAIHPGYGFLSENADFAQKIIDAGLMWIGPAPKSIKLMGDKSAARNIMQQAGVPVVPGFDVATCESSLPQAKHFAELLGYPVIIKDPLSGGGKAIRMVNKPEDFDTAWKMVLSESKKLTNSSHLLIEKYVHAGRHIEVQFAGNGKNFVHFFERECSIQRRHQKVIEEAPCKFVRYPTLEKMYQAALCAAKVVDYTNLGTVEFLVTPEENFYFLEMNTRLQVEHSVTELTCGVDLVALQFYIATSNKLPFTQQEISRKGHAIECRIYAEDPLNNFMPSSGVINHLDLPEGAFLRHDHDLYEGKEITPFFDPMISKITTFGQNRLLAARYMHQALDCFNVLGVKTNIAFLKQILISTEFITGNFNTQLLLNKEYINQIKANLNDTTQDMSRGGLTSEEVGVIATALLQRLKYSVDRHPAQTKTFKDDKRENYWKASGWK